MVEEVNATQAALLSGYSERTIRRRIASGQLPARRIASNRFAIRVSDLPARHGADPLADRVTALELRMHELDQQLQFLIAHGPADTRPEEQQDAVTTLRGLLLQLVQETGRLGPLLTMPEAESEWGEQKQSGG